MHPVHAVAALFAWAAVNRARGCRLPRQPISAHRQSSRPTPPMSAVAARWWFGADNSVAGDLSARGGAQGGDGGFIETSGEHVHIADSARVNTLAQYGRSGNWLIDPQDFTIAATGGDITGALLSTNLGTGNVTILSSMGATSGTGNIN